MHYCFDFLISNYVLESMLCILFSYDSLFHLVKTQSVSWHSLLRRYSSLFLLKFMNFVNIHLMTL